MTIAEIVALDFVKVHEEGPATLTAKRAALLRAWREADQRRQEWLERTRQEQQHG